MRQIRISNTITKREDKSLAKYFQEIGRVPLLTSEEEIDLSKRIQQGDKEALNKLTASNLRFVVSVSKQYQNQGLSLPDLINEGNLGLIKAAEKYDYTRGFKFISYAVWWIRQSIYEALSTQGRIVRLPNNRVGMATKVNKTLSKLEQEFEREPTSEEIAVILEMPEEEVNNSIRHSLRAVSTDAPMLQHEDNSSPMSDILQADYIPTPEDQLIYESRQTEIDRALSRLPKRNAEIIRLFFGLGGAVPLTMEEIGGKYDLSKERVRQIKESSLRKLKYFSGGKLLKSYL